jgi:hypothetical protein
MTQTPDRPNPGSDAAIAQGCTCPVAENDIDPRHVENHGIGWLIAKGCPVHDNYGYGLATAKP